MARSLDPRARARQPWRSVLSDGARVLLDRDGVFAR
jgi:hypothetical protein